jgi:nicotinamide mononucleotide transporter
MQAKRILENWWLWIGVDLFYIPLYWQKGMFLTALLYTIYLGLALWGWWQWKKIMQRQATPAT